jgi:xylose isomerase
MELKQAIITAFMGKTKDRFCEYHEAKTPEEKIAAVAGVKGAQGVEIVYPYELQDVAAVKAALAKHNLGVAAVNVNIKGEPEFLNGSSSSPVEAVRARAIDFIRQAMDTAVELGADKVTCCPLSDGYDYLFQMNYREAWRQMAAVFAEAAGYRRDVQLFLEYKSSETRVHCFLDSAPRALCLVRDINKPNLGITMDFGHALLAGENPAESICLIHDSGVPYYIHINDNDGKGDWDLIPATRNLWSYLEMLVYLKELNYTGWVTSDMSPTRLDPTAAFERTLATTNKLIDVANRLDSANLFAMMRAGRTVETLQWLEEQVLR